MVDWTEYKASARKRGALAMEVFVIVSTPSGDSEAVKQCLPDHLSYQGKLEADGTLMFAGPLSDLGGDNMDGAGMMIYKTSSIKEAKNIAEKDPMHRNGARKFTIRRWLINEGSLQMDIKLSAQSVRLTVD